MEPAELMLLLDDDVARLLQTEPTTGAAIVAAGLTGQWSDLGIEDGQAWVKDQRRKRKGRWT